MTESKSIKSEKLFVGREKEFGTIESLHYVIILNSKEIEDLSSNWIKRVFFNLKVFAFVHGRVERTWIESCVLLSKFWLLIIFLILVFLLENDLVIKSVKQCFISVNDFNPDTIFWN